MNHAHRLHSWVQAGQHWTKLVVRRHCKFRSAVASLELPQGLHPGATPDALGVQETLILRGFLEAVLLWRRGRDSPLPKTKVSKTLKNEAHQVKGFGEAL